MLKNISPEQKMAEFKSRGERRVLIGAFSVVAADVFLRLQSGRDPDWRLGVFIFVDVIVSAYLAGIVWSLVTIWIGRISLARARAAFVRPNRNPRAVNLFLENWWRNEFILDVFSVVLQTTVGAGLMLLFGPVLGVY